MTGVVVIALPDTDERLFALSGEHGPSLTDGVGILLLLAGFGVILRAVAGGWGAISRRLRASPALLAGASFLGGLGLGLLIAGVFTDFWWWWLVGGLILQALWLAAWWLARS